jgi:hypothetical protein
MYRRLFTIAFICLQMAGASRAAVTAGAPQFSKSAGFYRAAMDVELATATAGAQIRYTLDSSEPSGSSALYNQPIHIESTCIVRAVAFKEGIDSSPISTHSFFIAEKPELNDLPVLSLVTEPKNLWNADIGIYANSLESGDSWERPVSIEFFERRGPFGFSVDAGIRIHGGTSREPQKSAKKSFRLYFRSEYGPAKLHYPIIPSSTIQQFDCLVLRAGFNDAWVHWLDVERELTTYIRDPLVRDVFIDMGQPASRGDFIHMFLNGAYWGLYNLSERYNDDFCDAHFGKGAWDLVKPGADEDNNAVEASTGDLNAWNQFCAWFRNRDFSIESNYRDLNSWVDLDNFLDFYILNIFTQNYDWPRHNWYAARNRENGRWIFMPWDSEYAFGGGNQGYNQSVNLWKVIADQANYPLASFLDRLKKSKSFRSDVATRFARQFSTQLRTDHLMQLLNARLDQVRSAIPFEAERWGKVRPPYAYGMNQWLDAVQTMKDFIRKRSAVVADQLKAEGFTLVDH